MSALAYAPQHTAAAVADRARAGRHAADVGPIAAAALLTATVVLQDGSIVRVSEEAAEPELGFVVDSTYRLHVAGC